MRLLVITALLSFVQPLSAQIQHFESPEFLGISTAVMDDNTGQIMCYWKHSRNPVRQAGLTLYAIEGTQLNKVWEDAGTFFQGKGFDAGDFNNDGKLDFAAVGSGYRGNENKFGYIIAFYINRGTNSYEKWIVSRPDEIHHMAVGNLNDDNRDEVLFTELIDANDDGMILELKVMEWDNRPRLSRSTGIFKGREIYWERLFLSDVSGDGRDNIIIQEYVSNWSIQTYSLETRGLVHKINMLDQESMISVTKQGRILELGTTFVNPLSVQGGLKIAPIDIAELDFTQWHPMAITESKKSRVVVSRPARNPRSFTRRISVYRF